MSTKFSENTEFAAIFVQVYDTMDKNRSKSDKNCR